MGKVSIKSILRLCNMSSRSYATATAAETAAVVQAAAASAVRKKTMDSNNININSDAAKKDQSFWMKDPKTGNWIPETHFDEIDVVALREKFLPRPPPF